MGHWIFLWPVKVFPNISLVRSFFLNFWLLAGRIFLEYLLGWGYICIIYLWLVKYFLLLAEYFQTYKPGDPVADGKRAPPPASASNRRVNVGRWQWLWSWKCSVGKVCISFLFVFTFLYLLKKWRRVLLDILALISTEMGVYIRGLVAKL